MVRRRLVPQHSEQILLRNTGQLRIPLRWLQLWHFEILFLFITATYNKLSLGTYLELSVKSTR